MIGISAVASASHGWQYVGSVDRAREFIKIGPLKDGEVGKGWGEFGREWVRAGGGLLGSCSFIACCNAKEGPAKSMISLSGTLCSDSVMTSPYSEESRDSQRMIGLPSFEVDATEDDFSI